MTATADAPGSVRVDPQDALPESNWIPRRWFYFLRSIACLALIGCAIIFEAPSAVSITLGVVLILDSVVYGIAPSGEQAVKMFQIVSLLKGGVGLFQTQTATAGDGATATTTTASIPAAEPTIKPESIER